jgi:protein SCO1
MNQRRSYFCAVVFIFLGAAIASSPAADLPAGGGGRTTAYDYEAPQPGTYQLPVVKPAADGALVDSAGKTTSLSELTGGHITVVSFIYTRCGDAQACPYASNVLNQLHEASLKDGALARRLRLVSLSFDPEHDTPERLRDYASVVQDNGGGCEWRFVAPRIMAEVPALLAAYGQAVNRKKVADSGGPLYHTLRVYLIDGQRRIRNIYSTGTLDPRLVLADIRTLLLEEQKMAATNSN